MSVVTLDTFVVAIICVFVAAVFAASLSGVVYAVNKSNHEFYSRREDANQKEIVTLKEEVHQLKGQVAMLMGMINPKDYAVAP
jgi:cell division protein FtsB